MAERLAVLDFDLSLFKTYDFAETLESYYVSQGVDLSRLVYEQGTAPDLLALIEEAAGHSIDVDVSAIEKFALERFGKSPHDYIQPDAFPLLHALEAERDTDAAILTRGGERSQRVKLAFAARAIGEMDTTIISVDEPPKGELIAGWYENGAYHYLHHGEQHSAPNVILVDDKIGDFVGLPANKSATGMWVQRRAVSERERLLHRDLNRSGHHIFAINGLQHAIQLLKSKAA